MLTGSHHLTVSIKVRYFIYLGNRHLKGKRPGKKLAINMWLLCLPRKKNFTRSLVTSPLNFGLFIQWVPKLLSIMDYAVCALRTTVSCNPISWQAGKPQRAKENSKMEWCSGTTEYITACDCVYFWVKLNDGLGPIHIQLPPTDWVSYLLNIKPQ